MFTLQGVEACYGASQALYGVDFSMQVGEVVTLLGRNGMGKTTTVRAIMGMTPATAGSILFEGAEIQNLPSHAIARLGFGLVPEGRQIFPNLTLRENLLATAANPRLEDRMDNLGNQLSGGEQQMLAIARALMTNPKVLILDEATEGLAPLIREEIWQGLKLLKSRGESILIIDKNLDALMKIADHHNIMEKGRVVWSGTSEELADNAHLKSRYLGV